MKVWNYGIKIVVLGAFVVSASVQVAFAQKQLRYLPKVLQTPKVPAVVNPRLPLSTRVRLAAVNRAVNAAAARTQISKTKAVLTGETSPRTTEVFKQAARVPYPVQKEETTSYPQRFEEFAQWLEQLPTSHWTAHNDNTLQALAAVREALVHYAALPNREKPFLNGLLLALNKIRPHLQLLPEGGLQRLVYTAQVPAGQLPQAHHFHLQVKKNGLPNPFYHPYKKNNTTVWNKSFRILRDKNDPTKMIGFVFFQGYRVQDAHEEFAPILEKIIPAGYRVRMGVHELGLIGEDRTLFREGKLHLHLETIAPLQDPVPTDVSIQLKLSPKPFAGLIDVSTRQIILPNTDPVIAQNYLTLFGPFLDEEGRQALQKIIEE